MKAKTKQKAKTSSANKPTQDSKMLHYLTLALATAIILLTLVLYFKKTFLGAKNLEAFPVDAKSCKTGFCYSSEVQGCVLCPSTKMSQSTANPINQPVVTPKAGRKNTLPFYKNLFSK